MLTREELAKLALRVLSLQRKHFKDRTNAALKEREAVERELRDEAERIVEGNTLFGEAS
jgi:hypothetical protein